MTSGATVSFATTSCISTKPFQPWLAVANAKSVGADLSIVLGSSLRVHPAASLSCKDKKRHRGLPPKPKAVIVNLQPTPMDEEADLIIRATCDEVIRLLLE